jgi:2-(3-amino-3-carboxypropyl)histidine synthase
MNKQYKDLLENDLLTLAISKLPENYNFEIYKSILRVRELKEQLKRKPRVSLQFPDGFVIYSLFISDILEKFADCECLIIGIPIIIKRGYHLWSLLYRGFGLKVT